SVSLSADSASLVFSSGSNDYHTPIGFHDFGSVATGTSNTITFTVTNTSTSTNATAGKLTLGGTNPTEFTLTNGSNVCKTSGSNPSAKNFFTCPFSVAFKPTTAGAKSATVTLTYSGPGGSPVVLNLSGTGALPASLAFSPATQN